uniref:LRRNT domain-containing protein n=1 Tax=Knipowitschia caucasica TaxID=637954 RepID=A0AAV2ITK2_KNICA
MKENTKNTMHFPYFLDNYCPPECACYGRVVQCSDKGVDRVPYGIPYNSRYILLMNNHIDHIQLDFLSEYISMEFLALTNNRLTDGAIEGAFEGVPALKRLYLDSNQLQSVPIDLPMSLEELRLDNNQVELMVKISQEHSVVAIEEDRGHFRGAVWSREAAERRAKGVQEEGRGIETMGARGTPRHRGIRTQSALRTAGMH